MASPSRVTALGSHFWSAGIVRSGTAVMVDGSVTVTRWRRAGAQFSIRSETTSRRCGAVTSLLPALITAAALAVVALLWRICRRQSPRRGLVGLAVVAACAGTAAYTGQARGFFLLPTLVPFAVIAVCLISVLVGRPLTGLVLNRVIGGPATWWELPGLRRIHVISTLVCAAVNVVNGTLQAVFYVADQPIVLGVAHIATGPVFAVIVAVTIGYARRAVRGAVDPVGQGRSGSSSGSGCAGGRRAVRKTGQPISVRHADGSEVSRGPTR